MTNPSLLSGELAVASRNDGDGIAFLSGKAEDGYLHEYVWIGGVMAPLVKFVNHCTVHAFSAIVFYEKVESS
uniref:Dirigent protein n=1 Tax=Steinernema glaseri TaxID=37863 RepID=A0A1I7Z9H5_9BILA